MSIEGQVWLPEKHKQLIYLLKKASWHQLSIKQHHGVEDSCSEHE